MKKKAYWAIFIVIDDVARFQGKPNLTEVDRVRWFTLSDAEERVSVNRPEKTALLLQALQESRRQIFGHRWMGN